ncbi:MAG TPA: SelB C-terminal domain-containing protein [Acidimicrobiales bacterium]|nr:SelB C-terminal domain-containing protein [Acidimicrobiales bacterium]
MHVVATAGHVDHGKSSLVRALTGTDPDRLEEERRRGLTIDLGFAATSLPSGREIAFVDVPGHVRFIKNMLAGVGGVDACVFVVAATEGWKPQSEEHLRILELLGIHHGLVVLTKADALSDGSPDGEALLELARLEVAERLEGSFLAGADVAVVDSISGRGLAELTGALERLLAETPQAADLGRPRLWIDRAFAARGSGTVVTGTLTGGTVSIGELLEIVPVGGPLRHGSAAQGPHVGSAPALSGAGGPPARAVRAVGPALRVRALESHGRRVEVAAPGRRLALNLAGISHHEVGRGQALVRASQWMPTATLDASLGVLASLDHDVERRGAYQAFFGTGAYPARLRVLAGTRIEPGTSGLVRLRLDVALPLLPGDRYVLREVGRSETVGGGEVLDVAPRLPASKAHPDRSLARVVRERGFVESDLLERLTGTAVAPDVGGRWVADPDALRAAKARLGEAVRAAGPLGLDLAVLDARDRAVLEQTEGIAVSSGRALAQGAAPLPGLGGGATPGTERHWFVAALEEHLFNPPTAEECGVDRAELAALTRAGAVVRLGGNLLVAASAVPEAARRLAALLRTRPEGITASEARAALETSRKYALPLLAHLDSIGATRRRGDVRIAGPRLDALAASAVPPAPC